MGNVLEVSTMNRQQRRRQEKVVAWINSLSLDKQNIINKVVEERVDKVIAQSKKNTATVMDQVATSMTGALITLYEDITMEELEEVLNLFDDYLEENVDFVHREGAGWQMKLKKMEPDVLRFIERLLRNRVSTKELVEEVKNEFKDLTRGQIFNAIKMARTNIEKEKEEITTEEAVNYVFEKEINQDLKEKSKVIVEEVTASVEKEIREMDVKEKLKNKLEEKAEIMKAAEEEQKKQNKIIEAAEIKIEIEKKKLESACIDAEKIEKAIELIKDIDI